MKLDLSKLTRQTLNAPKGAVRVEISGPSAIEFDEKAFLGRITNAMAAAMRANLANGIRPDGAGGMPGRERDGKPRGMGAQILETIQSHEIGTLDWRVAPNEKHPGHLSRILREVPFTPPPLETLKTPVDQAFEKSVKVIK